MLHFIIYNNIIKYNCIIKYNNIWYPLLGIFLIWFPIWSTETKNNEFTKYNEIDDLNKSNVMIQTL